MLVKEYFSIKIISIRFSINIKCYIFIFEVMSSMTTERKKYKIVEYGVLAAVFLIIYYLSHLKVLDPWEDYLPIVRRLSVSVILIALTLLIGKLVEKVIDNSNEARGYRYNLIRIVRLLTATIAAAITIGFLFQNLYALAVSFGLASLVLGFALQAPITSFIAWLYIIFRGPYKVGDRIQINAHRGDVREISYLDTIIEECSGDYLGNDRKSGRLIHFPNSMILKDKVINYSGDFVPFIWNETAVQIAYDSDLEYVEKCLVDATVKDFKEKYPHRSLNGNEPDVYFRVNTYAWLEAVISYPVEPADTTGRRNRILRYALPMLNADPDKVGFPEGRKR